MFEAWLRAGPKPAQRQQRRSKPRSDVVVERERYTGQHPKFSVIVTSHDWASEDRRARADEQGDELPALLYEFYRDDQKIGEGRGDFDRGTSLVTSCRLSP